MGCQLSECDSRSNKLSLKTNNVLRLKNSSKTLTYDGRHISKKKMTSLMHINGIHYELLAKSADDLINLYEIYFHFIISFYNKL